ncbi:CYTH domain-containing protein [Microlunatus parietis]|uniref:CHAD domain-containing protein n=1 Tax=Microlunatus parietis TaxID=682979 RepID=A0A7Y9I780_9ACTN|nr:hypothetical protein [Microlunatus parietis]NYE71591.1 hypothetical protein [Microlunatus parietis]
MAKRKHSAEAIVEPAAADWPVRFEMPYPATAPRLINPDLGLAALVGRAGSDATYTMDVTVLDAPDHRLLRSGVVLAHRVVGERGEWYLAASAWAPLLPAERSEPMGYGDLPDELARLIRPFRRRAPLGPVAALTCDRREFEFRDADGRGLALLRDDRMTVRRGGVTTARYREVTLAGSGPGPTPEQRTWLVEALSGVGGTLIDEFPPLVQRLGAPATGLTDFPAAEPPGSELPFGAFVARWLAVRLRALIAADLRLSGAADDKTDALLAADVVAEVSRLRDEAEALSGVLDADWISDLDEELDWIVDAGTGSGSGVVSALRTRLRGERYLAVLDRLVSAIRAPKVGHLDRLPAGDVTGTVVDDARAEAFAAGDGLSPESGRAEWDNLADALAAYHRALRLTEIGPDSGFAGERRRLDRARQAFAVVTDRAQRVDRIRESAADTTPGEAFELGRRYERQLTELAADRAEFLRRWAKVVKKS